MITDDDMGGLVAARHKHAVGDYYAPSGTASWDGQVLILRLSGAALNTATAQRWPALAGMVARHTLAAPTIASLEADYVAATAPLATRCPGMAAEQSFQGRLAACRACEMWSESANGGSGRCDSVRGQCAKRRLWRAGEACPEGKWPKNRA